MAAGSPGPSRFKELESARARHGDELIDMVLQSVALSDVPADRLLAQFRALPPGAGWRMLEQAVAEGPESIPERPPELEAVVGPAVRTPDWVDLDLVDAGARAWWRAGGLPQLMVLTAGSLVYGYGTSFARPLLRTGRLTEMAPRRLGETARWTLVATRPGALRPGGEGVEATIRLRLVHTLVRAHLRAQGDWDSFNWGEPISVGDTMATGVFGFFIYPQRCLADLGVRYSHDELDAITHLWVWISHLLGVPEEFLPADYDEAAYWFDAMSDVEDEVEGAGRLVDALLFHGLEFERVLPRPAAAAARALAGNGLAALARRWMGDEQADRLGVPDSPLKHLVPLLGAPLRARELARAAGLRALDGVQVRLEQEVTERILDIAGTRPAALAPEEVEREPAVPAAA